MLHALESMATLLLMCDRRDLGTAVGERPARPGVETEWQDAAPSMTAGQSEEMKGIVRAKSYICTTLIPAASDSASRCIAFTICCCAERAN